MRLTDTSLIDFLAYISYAIESQEKGETPVRWLCLRDELVEHYLKVAKQRYVEWVDEERGKELSRKKF